VRVRVRVRACVYVGYARTRILILCDNMSPRITPDIHE